MQEDLQKNFILLSKVAKEKKYAQEYMGLLARRGDIGSIRIGKRWYTTWVWFEEFLENSQKQKKKEVVSEVQAVPVAPMKVEVEKIICPASEKEEVKVDIPFVVPEKEEIFVVQPAVNINREEKIAEHPAKITVAVKTRRFEMPVRKNIERDIREIKMQPKISQVRNFHQERNNRSLPQMETKFKNVFVEKKNENPLPYKEIKFRKNKDIFSPTFGVGESIEKVRSTFFPKLVFATSFAIMIFLIAASGYFVFSDGIFKKGTVAGANNERSGAFANINSGEEYFLARAGDKMKESLSVSRAAVQAAKEKGSQEN
jgi:hypothetical protein